MGEKVDKLEKAKEQIKKWTRIKYEEQRKQKKKEDSKKI